MNKKQVGIVRSAIADFFKVPVKSVGDSTKLLDLAKATGRASDGGVLTKCMLSIEKRFFGDDWMEHLNDENLYLPLVADHVSVGTYLRVYATELERMRAIVQPATPRQRLRATRLGGKFRPDRSVARDRSIGKVPAKKAKGTLSKVKKPIGRALLELKPC